MTPVFIYDVDLVFMSDKLYTDWAEQKGMVRAYVVLQSLQYSSHATEHFPFRNSW